MERRGGGAGGALNTTFKGYYLFILNVFVPKHCIAFYSLETHWNAHARGVIALVYVPLRTVTVPLSMTGVVVSDKNVNVTVSTFSLAAPALPLLLGGCGWRWRWGVGVVRSLLQQSGKQQVLSHWLNTVAGLHPDHFG